MLGSMAETRMALNLLNEMSHVSGMTSLPDDCVCGCRWVFEGCGISRPSTLGCDKALKAC